MHGTVHLFEQLPLAAPPPLPLARALPGRLSSSTRRVPLVGVIRNPHSHRGGATQPAWTGRATLLVETPVKRRAIRAILARFAEQRIDYLVVDGGDGTVRDVLTCGADCFGDSWPPLIVMPSGKTNALANDLGVPSAWTLEEALRLAEEGRFVQRQPLIVSQADNADARVIGFALGAGLYSEAIGLGQESHRKGAFNAVAVALTAVWTLLRALLGRADDRWRRATPMVVRDDTGRPVPHSGLGREDERYVLFASTLDRFPAGLRPFRKVAGALRMALMDVARPGLLLRAPLMLTGFASRRLGRHGYHLIGGSAFELELDGRFILDGEAFPAGHYRIAAGPTLRFVAP